MTTSIKKSRSTELLAKNIYKMIYDKGYEPGSHLPESYFAEQLKVSRTPVRSAFQFLAESGCLRKEPNKGFFLIRAEKSSPLYQEAVLHQGEGSLPQICFTIARDYLRGQLSATFTDADIAKQYNTTRSVAQTATTAMEAEGWIRRLIGYGWEFNDFLTSRETYDQCFRYRILIEPTALLEPTYSVDLTLFRQLRLMQEQRLKDGAEKQSDGEMYKRGSYFHESIVACSNNNFLFEGIKRANRLRRLIEYNIYSHRESSKVECEEHIHILDIIESGNLRDASKYLTRHLERARDEKIAIIEKFLP
ncbi:GntR family transcriptional regulator [Saccharospirillum alexandrii]|uniref:GntR family transcriptional regulator n=1 Tax=Saccharospirillum alexandrii TaxID=2448477 RepID=UPI000FDCC082|nr:GntR family transcriptional regulator [Saccharospirillum alexandrii]